MNAFMALFGLVWLLRVRANLCKCRACRHRLHEDLDDSDDSKSQEAEIPEDGVSFDVISVSQFTRDVTVQTDFDDEDSNAVELHDFELNTALDSEGRPLSRQGNTDKAATSPTSLETATQSDGSLRATDSGTRQSTNSFDSDPVWETEEVVMERGSEGLGISIAGGGTAGDVCITKLAPIGAAVENGRVHIGDILVQVNGVPLEGKTHSEAVEVLQNAGGTVRLKLRRARRPRVVTLWRGARGLGLGIAGGADDLAGCGGVFVSHIAPGGAAHYDGRLRLGDRILAVKDQHGKETQIEGATHADAVHALRSAGDMVTLIVMPSAGVPLPRVTVAQTGDGFCGQRTQATSCSTLHQLVEEEEEVSQSIPRCVRAVRLIRTGSRLGMDIIGGSGCAGEEPGVFVSGIATCGAARGILHRGDRILSVDGIDLSRATHQQAASALKYSGSSVTIMAQYQPEQYEMLRARIRAINTHSAVSTHLHNQDQMTQQQHGTFPR